VHGVLPFAALVGQEELKLALEMLAVDPRLGGVLIRGQKGTAKSTAARAMASLLPPIRVNAGCRYGCPADRPTVWCSECREKGTHEVTRREPAFETLPLGVTEDQLLGTLDLEHALRHGEQRFRPGILARVNQGVLYVDEVNLLDDHIVDLLLDVAAMGVNRVAREGVAVSHPAELMLVGTMNPEEGELRPQLLDRFGLCVEVTALSDPDERAEVVMRRMAFDADPVAFRAEWLSREEALARRIVEARALLGQVNVDRSFCLAAAELALNLGVDGQRGDVLLVKGAATLAALAGRSELSLEDLERAATVVLPHRVGAQRRQVADSEPSRENASERLRERVKGALRERASAKKKT
jgi:magnesium chelatase subunit D